MILPPLQRERDRKIVSREAPVSACGRRVAKLRARGAQRSVWDRSLLTSELRDGKLAIQEHERGMVFKFILRRPLHADQLRC